MEGNIEYSSNNYGTFMISIALVYCAFTTSTIYINKNKNKKQIIPEDHEGSVQLHALQTLSQQPLSQQPLSQQPSSSPSQFPSQSPSTSLSMTSTESASFVSNPATFLFINKNQLIEYDCTKNSKKIIYESKEIQTQKGCCYSLLNKDNLIIYGGNKAKIFNTIEMKFEEIDTLSNIQPTFFTHNTKDSYLVTNSQNQMISIIDKSYQEIVSWKMTKEVGDERDSFPTCGIIEPTNKTVHVCDTKNQRIKVYSMDGKLRMSYGGVGEGNGKFSRGSNYPTTILGPDCIALYQNRIYVSDPGNNLIQVFNPKDGAFINQIKIENTKVIQLIVADNRLFVITNDSRLFNISNTSDLILINS